MKKVLVCCTYWTPNISGLTRYAENLVNLLSNKFNFRILCSDHSGLGNDKKVTRSEVMFKFGKGVFMPWWWFDSYKSVKDVDIVNCHMPNLEAWIVCLWAKIYGKKIILTHHCEFGFSGSWRNKIIACFSFPFHWFSYLLADTIIAYTKDYAENGSYFLRIFSNKIIFILPPIVLSKEDKNYYLKLQKNINKKIRTIGFAGRLAWEKGLDILCNAIGDIENTRLMLAGPYKNLMGDETFKLVEKKFGEHKNKYTFLGPLNPSQLTAFYKAIDCLALPSTDNLETFGLVQAEAMLCGTPVIASNLPGVRMPVKMTGMGEIAKVGEPQDLANKINIVLDNRKKYTKGRKQAKKIFDIEIFKRAYTEIFKI